MKLTNIFRGDRTLWVLFLLLTIVSLVEVYSSIGLYAYTEYASKTPSSLFLRHMAIVAATWVAAVFLSRVDYRYFSRAFKRQFGMTPEQYSRRPRKPEAAGTVVRHSLHSLERFYDREQSLTLLKQLPED